jgi:hypothetical protein
MKIITALFGRKTPADHPTADTPRLKTYIDRQLALLRTCTSTDELSSFASDYSGYMRQAALVRCVELARPDLLSIVVDRLNDWVPQVRDSARTALMTLQPVVPVPQLLATLPSILRLQHAGRADHTEWVERYEQNLIRYATVQELTEGAQSPDIHVARACSHILKKYRLIEPASLIRLFLEYRNDIVVALMAVQLCSELSPEDQRELYLGAMRSHFGAVRTVALRSLLSLEGEFSRQEAAISALLDVQSSARAVAIAFLRESGFDVRTYYRRLLEGSRCSVLHVKVGLVSLAGVGGSEDIDFVRTYAKAEHPAIRLAALSAWAKLDPSAKDTVATEALLDASPRIRKFALQMTRKQGAYIPFESIRSALKARNDDRLLLLFAESNKWNWLECIARMAVECAEEDGFKAHLVEQLDAWCRRAGGSYEQPSAEQRGYLTSEPVRDILTNLLDGRHDPFERLQAELRLIA